MESKRTYRLSHACTGLGCEAKFTCGAFLNFQYREQAQEVIRPPFTKTDTGKFKSCDKMISIRL